MAVAVSRLGVLLMVGMFSFINIFVFYNYVNHKHLLNMELFPRPTAVTEDYRNVDNFNAKSNSSQKLDGHNKSNKKKIAGSPKPVNLMFDSENYILKSDQNCSSQQNTTATNYIVICVCSAIGNFRTRQVIRETWGSQKTIDKFRIIILFFVGTTSNIAHQRALNNESIQYDDLIQTDFKDTYRNLTLKSVSMIRWVSESCPNATFVIKIDDDCYLNLPFLLKELSKIRKKRAILIGYLLKYVRPVRDVKSKYHVSSLDYHWKIYPNYLSGSCYVMSGEMIPTMFEKCHNQSFMPMEDIFVTGICAKRIGVSPMHNSHFVHWKLPSNGCDYRDKIMGHFVKTEDLIKVWNDMVKLTNKSYKCVLKPRVRSRSRRHK